MIDKAYQEGRITEELYPDKPGITEIMKTEAIISWNRLLKQLKELEAQTKDTEEEYSKYISSTPQGVEPIVAGDFLAFTTIWNSMSLVKIALESKGVYVNHKPTAVKQFVEEYKEVDDVKLISELDSVWSTWHHLNPSYSEAQDLSNRLYRLALSLDQMVK